jgi:hypothetical protein
MSSILSVHIVSFFYIFDIIKPYYSLFAVAEEWQKATVGFVMSFSAYRRAGPASTIRVPWNLIFGTTTICRYICILVKIRQKYVTFCDCLHGFLISRRNCFSQWWQYVFSKVEAEIEERSDLNTLIEHNRLYKFSLKVGWILQDVDHYRQ